MAKNPNQPKPNCNKCTEQITKQGEKVCRLRLKDSESVSELSVCEKISECGFFRENKAKS